jgi:hypothetical protein
MTTAGKVLFFLGLALSVIAVIVGLWGLNRAIQDFSQMEADAFPVQGETAVPMDEGDVRFILADEGTDPTCSVTDPSGSDLPVTSDGTLDTAAAQEGATVVGMFTAAEAGEHTVACDAAAQVSPALSFSDAVGVGAAGLAFLSLFPLGFLTLLGLVLWLVGRNRDKNAAAGPGGYGYSTSSGYGAQEYGAQEYGQGYGTPGQGSDQGYGAPGQGYGGRSPEQGWGTPPPPPGPSTGSPYASPPPPPGSDTGQRDEGERRDGPA